MGGGTPDQNKRSKKAAYDLADFIGSGKYYFVDPSAQNYDPMKAYVDDNQGHTPDAAMIQEALSRLGVVPQDEGMGF